VIQPFRISGVRVLQALHQAFEYIPHEFVGMGFIRISSMETSLQLKRLDPDPFLLPLGSRMGPGCKKHRHLSRESLDFRKRIVPQFHNVVQHIRHNFDHSNK